MSTALAVIPNAAFDEQQVALIRSQVAPPGTTNDELALFLAYCQRTGLDPFARQIYLSERRAQVNGNWVTTRKPETTIDGFRLIADRTERYAGQLGPFWCGEDGVWRDVWVPREAPVAARVGVLRHDFKEPLFAVALYDEYVQTTKDGMPNSMWRKMPANQLAKCAESLALRRAFPRELSGLYTREEMPDPKEDAKAAQQAIVDAALERERLSGRDAEATGSRPATSGTNGSEANHKGDREGSTTGVKSPEQKPTVQSIEDRRKKQDAEALAELNDMSVKHEPRKAAPPASGSYKMLSEFGALKEAMRALMGTDSFYYEILKRHGFAKSTEIPDKTVGAKVFKDLKAAHAEAKRYRGSMDELKDINAELVKQDGEAAKVFWRVMAKHGQHSVADVPPDVIPQILDEVRGLMKAV